jgi:AmmeMemoRadiSam system protein B
MPLLSGGPIPPLRGDLEAVPFEKDGQESVAMTDLLGIDERAAVLPLAAAVVASLFDGKRTAAEVVRELARQGAVLKESDIQSLADQLDRLNLLDTPASRDQRRKRLQEFHDSPVRPFHAESRGFPSDPLEMAAYLGKFFGEAGGPIAGEADPPVGLAAPHIDFARGGGVYANIYGELAKRRPPDVIVALGVAHMSPNAPWTMTRKAYGTPFGPMSVDADLYGRIAGALWYDPSEEEWVHVKEHSLEFQALWLKYLWRDKTPPWVPILCSGFDRFCSDRSPASVPTVEKAVAEIGALLAAEKKKGRRVMVLAGVDLSHVGKRFGDAMDVDDALKAKIEKFDREGLAKAMAGDAEGFFLGGIGDNAWRKVCGLSALYTAVRWIRALSPGAQGTIFGYDQKPDPAGGIVSFAGILFE